MKKHTINKEEFEDYITEDEIAFCYGSGENKSLRAFINHSTKDISYKIYNKKELVAEVQELPLAIDIYNAQ